MRLELASVSFENYKSFKERAELNLNRVNYLIGPNGAGKSNVLAGINLISAVIRDGKLPNSNDCFDGMDGVPTSFSFTAKLSKDERRKLAEKTHNYSETKDPDGKAFEFLKYEVSFQDNQQTRQRLSLSDVGENLQPVQELPDNDNVYRLGRCGIENIDLDKTWILTIDEGQVNNMNVNDFLASFDRDVQGMICDLFSSIRTARERKEFSGSASVKEDTGVSSDGRNLPNQLITMFNDRSQIQKFARRIRRLSSGEITLIDSHVKNQEATIQLRERGRKTTTSHPEISSGHNQQVILQHILYRFEEPIIMIEEPELHLHAAAQKNLLDFIRNDLPNKQVIIATHSPIFVNVSETESVFLLRKPAGGSTVTRISPSDADLVRASLGISYADILQSDYLCCVEGKSEEIAIPALARRMGLGTGLSAWVFNIGGYGNVKHLELLLGHLKASGKRFFLLLDKNGIARDHMDRLLRDGLFEKGQYHFLQNNFEDLFPSATLIKCSRQLALEYEIEFGLSEEDLDRLRQDRSVTVILEEEWQRSAPGHGYPKADLAELLAEDSDPVPGEAAAVVRRVMEGLGVEPA